MRVLKALLCIVLFSTVSAFGQTGAQVSPSGNEFGSLWFVELARAPLADVDAAFTVQQRLNYLAQLRADKQAFRDAAAAARIAYRERRAFDVLWNGLSVEIDPVHLPRLARVPGVRALYPVGTASIPQTQSVAPDLVTALAMTGADTAQEEMGLTGAGVKVAIIDTGIDYDHQDLGGDGTSRLDSAVFPTARVVAGWDFVGDAFNADATSPWYDPEPRPDSRPDDCNGHGTHVAGIVGAGGTPPAGAKGVAPQVRFGAYRVFGCTGSTTFDIIIAAMEQALSDGMHVVNMSLGSAFQWPQHPAGQASDRLVNKGVVVVASIGNSGANGLYSTGVPGNASKVIGVASYDNTHVELRTFTVTPANLTIGYGNAAAAPPAPTSGSLPLAKTGTPTTADDACTGSPTQPAPGSLTGKAVLIRRGTCTFHQKALNAQNAGAAAVVLYNNVPGRFSPTVAGTPAVTIPVVAVSDTEGVAINNAINAGPQVLNWTDQTGRFPNPTGGLISSFSSYGVSPDLVLKPDLGAPGGLIRSTVPLEQGGYATISGTSMSAPHVAGGVALLLEARPRTPAQAVRGILLNSALPKVWWGNPGLGFLDNTHRQGGGMLQVPNSIAPTIRIEPAKLSLGETQGGVPVTRTLTVENNTNDTVTFNLSHAPALSTGPNTFTPSFATGFASAAFSASSITLLAKAKATIEVTITPNPALADRSLYGGYIVFTRSSGGQVYRVPYAGFKGDYQSIPALTPTPSGFPWLARRVNVTHPGVPPLTDWQRQGAGATFTFVGEDVPWIILHLDHQVRRLRAEVFDTSGRSFQRAFEFQYVGRNGTATGFFAIPWDGRTTRGTRVADVPNGSYVIRLSVQKALGEDDDPAHWESWTSPVFGIARPAGGSSP